jgi:hypothetical protein
LRANVTLVVRGWFPLLEPGSSRCSGLTAKNQIKARPIGNADLALRRRPSRDVVEAIRLAKPEVSLRPIGDIGRGDPADWSAMADAAHEAGGLMVLGIALRLVVPGSTYALASHAVLILHRKRWSAQPQWVWLCCPSVVWRGFAENGIRQLRAGPGNGMQSHAGVP